MLQNVKAVFHGNARRGGGLVMLRGNLCKASVELYLTLTSA